MTTSSETLSLLNLPCKPNIDSQFSVDSDIVLFNGDAKKLLQTIPDNTIQLIITSPPYNLGKDYETRTGLKSYLESQKEIINELNRVLTNSGSICWQVGNYVENGEVFPLDIYYYDIFKDLGLKLRNRIVWHFGHGLHASKRFSGRYETILWFTKSDNYCFNLDNVRVPSKYPGKLHFKGPNIGKPSGNPLGKNPSDFWQDIVTEEFDCGIIDIPNVKSNHPEKTSHPCQYPVELVERFVLALTNPNDWVFDPYSGVGSTIIAAIKNLRKGMGAEKEIEYNKLAKTRIEKYYSGDLKLRQIGTPVYEPTGKEKVSQIPLEWKTIRGVNENS
ncbi:MAG TPA: site-specific DNA-methyltransferase [Anaerolineaceae bacterium]|nr:site-specific DNA-methyltransferase [Anaerolineaceae bacterium]